MKKSGVALCMFLAFALFTAEGLADIYMFIDSEGIIHFTNTPTSSDYKLYIKESPDKKEILSRDTSRFDTIIQEASQKFGVDFSLVKAVIQVESGFNHEAVSRKGATGLMQIMPQNYTSLNISDPFDPSQNIMAGTLYLKRMIQRFDHKLPLALAAYNAGPDAVDRYQTIPPFSETQQYVKKVMEIYSTLKKT